MVIQLHNFQENALLRLKIAIGQGGRRVVVAAPTGAGKTVIATSIVAGALRKGNRVMFTVPALSLIDQTVRAFEAGGIDGRLIGVIQADHPRTNLALPVQVASVQTLARRTIPETDVVVIDECHIRFAVYDRWMAEESWKNIPFIGLSATPWSRGLGKVFNELIVATTTQDLIDQGYLAKFKVRAPSHPDLTGVATVRGDYDERQLSDVMSKAEIVGDVVDTWREHGDGRPTFCFAVDRAHARLLAERFELAGVPVEYMDGETPREEREEIRKRFHSGETKVVCNVGVLTTGVDWDVRCLILARPTKSAITFTQIVGRALRTAEGKSHALILDHTDTHLRLGFVTDLHREELDSGEPIPKGGAGEKAKPLPKECPSCKFLKPAGAAECPNCGFVTRAVTRAIEVSGDLDEADPGKKTRHTPSEKRRWYAELQGYASEYGKTEKWCLANYRQKFGEWPYAKENILPEVPSVEVRMWIKSRQIAWAKSRGGKKYRWARRADRYPEEERRYQDGLVAAARR